MTASNSKKHDHGEHPSPLSRLIAFFRPEGRDIGAIVVYSIIAGVLYLATPLAVDAVVNSIAFGGEQRVYVQALVILSIALLFLLGLLSIVRAAQDYVMELIQRRIFVRLAADLAYRLPRARMEALAEKQSPELVNRFFDVVVLQKSAAVLLLDGINVVFSTLIGLVVLSIYHPLLMMFAVVLSLMIALIVFVPMRRGVNTSIRESYAKHAVVGWLEQIVMYPILFRTRGGAALARDRVDELVAEYLAARSAHFTVLISQILALLGVQAIASAALLTLGGWLVLRGELTLGQLVASELILAGIVASLAKMGKHLEKWYDAMAAIDKLGYLVDLPVERECGETPSQAETGGFSVELNNLTFAYDPDHVVFENLCFSIRPGDRVGIASAAGHGASTLLNILSGLRNPTSGAAILGGLDLRHWNISAIRRDVALVRGHELAEGTIADNIRLGRSDVSHQDVQQALKDVGLLDALLRWPDGLGTHIKAGGAPLSSAHRNLVMLARAIVGRPRLLLIDENLEGMDVEFLPALELLLFDKSRNWTVILVTRDPDLLARCDSVLNLGDCHLSQSHSQPPA